MPRFVLAALLASALTPAALIPTALKAQDAFFSVATDEDIGPYIVGPGDRPVYMFDTEARGGDFLPPLDSCDTRCRAEWPPLYVDPSITPDLEVSDELDPKLAQVVVDGERLVAVYNDHPLFYFAREDENDGPSGHGISTHGGWWIALAPDGEPIRTGTISLRRWITRVQT